MERILNMHNENFNQEKTKTKKTINKIEKKAYISEKHISI